MAAAFNRHNQVQVRVLDEGAASARLSRWALMPVATKPPKAAAIASVSRVGSGRMGVGSLAGMGA
ncbi:hypothetical protein, partial [Escherichia coli]|uniref:hypothetical protein n=1 Tax=Escherichia coli TaxID=562 RepID=UPI003BA0E845